MKELTANLERSQYELQRSAQDLKELRSGNQLLDATKYSQEKSITEQMLLNQALQREVKDKEVIVQKSQVLIASLQEQAQQLTETNNVYKTQIKKMEDKLETSKQEIIKGNGIISKQQADFKEMKQKFKLKSTVVMQQEQVVQ